MSTHMSIHMFVHVSMFIHTHLYICVSVAGDVVSVEGKRRHVTWADSQHHSCVGTIKSVGESLNGTVLLEDCVAFENPLAVI